MKRTLTLGCILAMGFTACSDEGESQPAPPDGSANLDGAVVSDAAGDPCLNATPIPADVSADLSVGPGCVSAGRTVIRNSAKLTIRPGTTVLMKSTGHFDVGTGGPGALIAVGTPTEPIVFKSIAPAPLPGDWECVFFGAGSVDSEIKYATFHHGGALCKVNGSPDNVATIILQGGIRGFTNSGVNDSLTHGIIFRDKAGVRAFENNQFARNGKNGEPSLLVATNEIVTLGTPNTFADADDFIGIQSTFSAKQSGTWKTQSVPFVTSGFQIDNSAEIKIAAGNTIKVRGGSVTVFDSNLVTEGTAAQPVTFTSANAAPLAGDWGCITFESVKGSPQLKGTVIEYAGSGSGCTGAKYKTAIFTSPSLAFSDVKIRNVAGYGITSNVACANAMPLCTGVTFSMLSMSPINCLVSTPNTLSCM